MIFANCHKEQKEGRESIEKGERRENEREFKD